MNKINIPPKYKKLLNILILNEEINQIKTKKKFTKPSAIEFLLYIIMSLKKDLNRTIIQIIKLFVNEQRINKMLLMTLSNIYTYYYKQKNNITDPDKEKEIYNEVYNKLSSNPLISMAISHISKKITETFFYYLSSIIFGKTEDNQKYWNDEIKQNIIDYSVCDILSVVDSIPQFEKFYGGITYNKINKWDEKKQIPLIIACDDINIPVPENLELFWGSELTQIEDEKYVEKNINKIYNYIITQSNIKDEKDKNKLTQGFYAELIKNSLTLLSVLFKSFMVGIKALPEIFYSDNTIINDIIKNGLLRFINDNIISNNIKINQQDLEKITNPYKICEIKKMEIIQDKNKELLIKAIMDIIIGTLVNLLLIYVMKLIKKYIKNSFINKTTVKIQNLKDLSNKILKKYSVPFF